MASYRLEWRASVHKDLRGIPAREVQKIVTAAESLIQNPFPSQSLKLSGSEHAYRLRVGNYRLIYTVFADVLIIEIVKVGHRKDVYRE